MLLSFRAANHRSLKTEQELDLRSVYDSSREALSVAAIYGPNASGKSSVLDAFSFMHDLVTDQSPGRRTGDRIPRSPFLLDEASASAPSSFAVELLLTGVRYVYGFTLGDNEILEEWCYSYPKKAKRILMERHRGEYRFGTTTQGQRRALLTEITPRDVLFLTTAAKTNEEPFASVASWFRDFLWFSSPSEERGRELAQAVLLGGRAAVLVRLLQAADLGITSARLDENTPQTNAGLEKLLGPRPTGPATFEAARWDSAAEDLLDQFPSSPSRTLKFRHAGVSPAELSMGDESRGTRVWFDLLGLAINALENGWTLVLDELDSGLHPLLLQRFVQFFRDPTMNPRSAQLIFTTHDVSLLGRRGGDELLSRDEVWFVEKDHETGASNLFPLSDFRPRDGLNWEKRYLGGALGAVPYIDDSRLAVLQSLESQASHD